ncbi:MAG: PqqD family protein [Bacteroidales bacterium]|nr:PqqD family protein [Bacteroidales bacterium]
MRFKSNVLLRDVAGEKALFLQGRRVGEMTKVIALNESSLLLWDKLNNSDFVVEDVAKVLMEHYEVDSERALADASRWIERLSEQGLFV